MGVCCIILTLEQVKEKADLLDDAKLILVEDPKSGEVRMLSGRKWIKETKQLITPEGTQDLAIAVFITVDLSGREYTEAVALVQQIKGEVDDQAEPFGPLEVILK
jgi:hypothetical protein